MPAPQINTLPPAPNRANDGPTFSALADAFVAGLAPLPDEINAATAFVDQNVTDLAAAVNAVEADRAEVATNTAQVQTNTDQVVLLAAEVATNSSQVATDKAEFESLSAQVSADADQVSTDRAAAESAKDQAVLASEGSGVAAFYDTFADADDDNANLTEGDVVRIFSDETKFFDPTIRRLEGGSLKFKYSAVSDESFLFEFYRHNESIDFQISVPADAGVFEFSLSTTGGNVVIDWGDGSADEVGGATAEYSHTYASSGSYRIVVGGEAQVSRLSFENGTGELITRMNSFGRYQISLADLFNAVDISGLAFISNNPVMTKGVNNMTSLLEGATDFNQDIGQWDLSSVVDTSRMFISAAAFNQDIGQWDVGRVTDMSNMFLSAIAFNQDIGQWDVSSVVNMGAALRSATAFNQDIGQWDVSNVVNMTDMFRSATAFDQDLGQWNVSIVTTMTNMFLGVTLSTPNYDSLLSGWESRSVQNDVVFHGGNSQYTIGSAAEAARASLINDHGWVITDGGGV